MWFRKTVLRLSIRSRVNKTKFREIKWTDDGELRPVTRGKSKQFLGFDENPPIPAMTGVAPYRMRSNLSYASQAPLISSTGLLRG